MQIDALVEVLMNFVRSWWKSWWDVVSAGLLGDLTSKDSLFVAFWEICVLRSSFQKWGQLGVTKNQRCAFHGPENEFSRLETWEWSSKIHLPKHHFHRKKKKNMIPGDESSRRESTVMKDVVSTLPALMKHVWKQDAKPVFFDWFHFLKVADVWIWYGFLESLQLFKIAMGRSTQQDFTARFGCWITPATANGELLNARTVWSVQC